MSHPPLPLLSTQLSKSCHSLFLDLEEEDFPILVIPQLMESLQDHYSHDQRADILLSVPTYTYYPHITAEAALVANDLNSGTSFSNLKPNGMGLSISPD